MKIKTKAIGVNRADVFFQQGKYPVFGLEVAGLDESGRRVAAIVEGGAYAKEVDAKNSCILPIPDHMSFEDAASIIESLFTAYYNLVSLCALRKDEKVLIHGGASGVGVVAIQLARLLGAEVFATAGKPEKLNLIESLGAEAIDYKNQDFTVMKYDVILDIIGADYFDKNLAALNKNGRLAIISFIGGAKKEVNLGPLLTKSLTVFGSTINALSDEMKADLRNNIEPYFSQIKPVIAKTFPFSDYQSAIDYVKDYKNAGKVVVSLGS